MEIKELAEKYNLTQNDFWKCHNSWIVRHDAVEKIAVIEGIELVDIEKWYLDLGQATFMVTMKLGDKTVKSIGEANIKNCKSSYLGCMAEKRGIDRCVLKLIHAYEYGIYSDAEADDFKKGENNGSNS